MKCGYFVLLIFTIIAFMAIGIGAIRIKQENTDADFHDVVGFLLVYLIPYLMGASIILLYID